MKTPQMITYPCSYDNSLQRAQFMAASAGSARPLVVALHTWSYDCTCMDSAYAELAERYDWHFIYPDFRGPNWTPLACGSEAVIADVVDAAKFVIANYAVDMERIYLIGGSGGGHCALLVAARRPELWAAVSAWCPISDIARWHREVLERPAEAEYATHIEKACGGNPESDWAAKAEAERRSGITYLSQIADYGLPIAVNTGIHDGHTGSVPVGHALRAFNCLAAPQDVFSEECIASMEQTEVIPDEFRFAGEDPAYETHPVLLRRVSKNVRISLFEGGHDCLPVAGYEWLSRQQKGRKADFASSAEDYLSLEVQKTHLSR